MTTLYDDGADYDRLAMGDAADAETDFYAACCPSGGSILELACGTGRLTLPLAERGFAVTGLDNSESMLATAEVKAATSGTAIDFVRADLRDFDLGRTFDLVFLPNNSLGHLHTLPDIQACFAAVRRHLSKTGRFVLEMFNPSLPLLMRDPNTQYPITKYVRADDQTVAVAETVRYDAATQISHGLWHYQVDGEPPDTRSLDLRVFFPQELDALLTLSGFTVAAKYGGFDRVPFTGESRRQLVVCRSSLTQSAG